MQVLSLNTVGEYTHQRSHAYESSDSRKRDTGRELTSDPDATRHISEVPVQCLIKPEMDQALNIRSQGPVLGRASALDLSFVIRMANTLSTGLRLMQGRFTSMVRSSSILTALPKMNIYCIRFENSQAFLILVSKLRSGAGSGDSISSRPRFREPIVIEARSMLVGFTMWLVAPKAR